MMDENKKEERIKIPFSKKIKYIGITAIITAAISIPGTIYAYKRYDAGSAKRYFEKSRQKQITCDSGEVLNVYIPEGYNDITKNYNTLHKESIGYDGDLDLRQDLVIGDGVDVPSSTTTVYAEVYSSIAHMYEQIYSDFSKDDDLGDIYSATVKYHKNGTLPDDDSRYLNFKIDKLEDFTASGINFTLYKVYYDNDYTQYYDVSGNEIANPEKKIEPTNCLTAVSDTDDVIEVTIYTDKDRLVDDGTKFIKDFLMVDSDKQ